ncbi:hypothetical protein LCGC14_1990680 [marine sediment metagenome]|uniref:Uncharacterized protein n=1 Tax=marine sediment metagenome TaxID=412755 RepID=A0A0F9F617_9ZZZZ
MTAKDTFVDVIALTSPSGRMSKRALKATQERIRKELFPDGLAPPSYPQPTKAECLLHQAAELRSLAARGMRPRSYLRKAEALEREAASKTKDKEN